MVSTLVFPPPGCADAQRIVEPFTGFDVLSSTGGSFVNLLTNSVNLSKQSWIRGSGSQVITSSFDVIDWYTNDQQILDKSDVYVLSNSFGDNLVVTGSPNAYLGQRIPVSGNTTYTASFFAKRGTATELTYGVYDLTNEQNIVEPTSYYNETGTTYSRIEFTFVTAADTEEIIFYPIWAISSGSPGSVNISAPQVQESSFASAYDATTDVSLAALGIETVSKSSYNITTLSSFVDPDKNFEPIGILGQSKARWNTVNDYIFDTDILTYSARPGNNVLDISENLTRPYNVGDTVTVSSTNPTYRQNFTVTAFTTTSITLNTTSVVPVNGAVISNPNPTLYPQTFETINLNGYKRGVTSITRPRENLYLSTISPNDRAVEYVIDRDLLSADSKLTDGRINVTNIVRPATQISSAGRVELKNNFREVSPRRTTNRVESLTPSTGFVSNSFISSWRGGVFSASDQFRTGRSIFVNPLFEPGLIRSVEFPDNTFRLEPFNNQGVYVGPLARVTDTDNIRTFDTVRDFIFDESFSTTQQLNQYPTFLYFNPAQDSDIDRIRFPKGSFVKISNIVTGEFLVTEVLDTSVNGIQVNISSTLANEPLGNISIQDASPFSYPKEKVVLDNLTLQLPIELVSNPRDNLYISEQTPFSKGRSLNYFIGRDISEVPDKVLVSSNRLETFETNGILPPDYSFKVVGENTSIKYNTALWYSNDDSVLTYTVEPITTKILYFEDQPILPFKVDQQIRLKNADIGYNVVATVLESSNRHVTIAIPDDYPGIGNLYVESTTTSVYPQSFVYTNVAPTNARENLFYFNLLPALRAGALPIGFTSNTDNIQANSFRDNIRIKEATARIDTDFLEKQLVALRDTTRDISVPKINIPGTRVSAVGQQDVLNTLNINAFASQNNVRPTTNPRTPAERFFYFTLAPGYRSNSTINYGVGIFSETNNYNVESLTKDITELKTVGEVFRINSLRNVTPLVSDRITFDTELISKEISKLTGLTNLLDIDLISKFKTVDYISLDLVDRGSLKAATKVIAIDNRLPQIENLKSNTVLKQDQIFGSRDIIDRFTTRNYTSLVLNDRGKLTASAVVRESVSISRIGKVTAATILRPDRSVRTLNRVDNFYSQSSTVITNVFPAPPRENLIYDLLAPGYRYNRSIQQGFVFDNNFAQEQTFNYLEKFNIGGNFVEVYPTSIVRPTTAPTNPREMLAYSILAPGYKTNSGIQRGFIFDSNNIPEFTNVSLLQRDAWKLSEDRSNNQLIQLATLEKSLLSLREIYPDSVKYSGFIDTTIFGETQNEFFELKLETKGDIIRLKTTSYSDIAAPKKEPIQFWN